MDKSHERRDECACRKALASRRTTDELSRLESALHDSDRLFTDSLREDERRRRRRRLVSLTLLLRRNCHGNHDVAVLAGWLTLVAPPPADGTDAKSAEAAPLDEEAKIERAEELAGQGLAAVAASAS